MAGNKGAAISRALLLLIYNNTTITLIGDADGLLKSAADGNLYVSLHTADPTAGDQTTNEAAYTGYARVAVARTAAGWTVSAGNAVENFAEAAFPVGTGGGEHVTHWAVGAVILASGAGKIVHTGECTPHLDTGIGVIPTFAAGAIEITES